MASMISEVYDAFLDAGASQEKARKAAEAVAGHEARVDALDRKSSSDPGEIKVEFAGVRQEFSILRGEVNLLKWMVGFNTALSIAVLLKLLFP